MHAAHFSLGGVAISPDAATTVPGLFAAGEVGGGHLGAGRRVGTGISTGLIFGQIAGANAARYAQTVPEALPGEVARRQVLPTRGAPRELGRQETKDLSWTLQGVLARGSKPELESALEVLHQAEASFASTADEDGAFVSPVLHNLLVVGKGYLQAALLREESRGAHLRDDFPARNDASFNGSFVISKGKAPSLRLVSSRFS